MPRILLAVAAFVLWIYCLVDLVQTPAERVRHLPKWAWLVIVFLFPFVGSLLWLFVGREPAARRPAAPASPYPEYERPGRMAASDPVKDEEFLRKVRERAEQQRRAAEEQRRRRAAEEDAGDAADAGDEAGEGEPTPGTGS
ncbi:PLD nuclease N-terminal domain-containing protein [Nocardioides sp. SYSU D00038]|uniref:PLD nuclease N-terminal domain-containing protein n=1 Tax=Nocardioides sp. SYSU D00038 TaxID=2812554 RepID=UPI001F0887FD|nr:PLD nuclease N-terminal domain-containing protein [Nocardioides sp. SYSU D00038]